MPFWQESLGLLAVLWACQGAGSWVQMRHYGEVMRGVATAWPDGCVGASAARGTLGKGVVAIVVASPDAVVRQVFLMEGRSVFAKFREWPEARGRALAALASDGCGVGSRGRNKAIAGAIAQIDKALARRGGTPASALAA